MGSDEMDKMKFRNLQILKSSTLLKHPICCIQNQKKICLPLTLTAILPTISGAVLAP